MEENDNDKKEKWYENDWLKRIGVAGFLFFLIKGLVWLALGFGLLEWFNR